ncbi:MAG: hypothetical protein ACRD1P_11570 [Thermoanaerobaculia bacterium]
MTRKNIFAWNSPRRLLKRSEVDVAVWEERDRLHIHIRDKKTQQRTIAEWWDDDARQMFEDGFFKSGRDLERSVLDYAEEMGLIAKGNADFAWPNRGTRRNIFAWNNPWYHGYKHGGGNEAFFSKTTPTVKTHGHKYIAVTGPFRTRDEAVGSMRHWHYPPFTEVRRGKVREIHEPLENPGKEQAWLAEQFVKGANSGVAGSIYVHGSTIYSYGPHFPIARREGDLILITTKHSPSRTTSGHIGLVKRAAQQAGKEIAHQELASEAAGPAGYSNPLTRRESSKEIREIRSAMSKGADFQRMGRDPDWQFGYAQGVAGVVHRHGPKAAQRVAERAVRHLRYNPAGEGRGNLEDFARSIGLYLATWAPGDGVKRYRFFTKPSSYDEGSGIYTAIGLKEAWCFVRGYAASKTGARGNPVSADARSFISGKIPKLIHEGYPSKQAQAIAYSMARKAGYKVPVRANCCSNPLAVTHPAGHAAPPGQILGKWQLGVVWGTLQNVLSWGAVVIDGQQIMYKRSRYWAAGGSSYRDLDAIGKFIGRQVVAGVNGNVGESFEIYGRRSIRLMRPSDHPETPEGLALLTAEFHPKAGPATRVNPLTVAEGREISEEAMREALIGGQTKSPGSRGYHLGRSTGMVDVVRKYGPEFARANPYSIVKRFGKGTRGKAAAEKYLRENFENLSKDYYDLGVSSLSGEWMITAHLLRPIRNNPLLQTVMLANPSMTLAQWAAKQPYRISRNRSGVYVIPDSGLVDRSQAWHLSNYVVSAVSGGSIWFSPRVPYGRRNPPVSQVWDTLTHRRRHAALEFAGFPDDYAWALAATSSWHGLTDSARRALVRSWQENPLTRKEAGSLLHVARSSAAKSKSPTLTKSGRSYQRGFATGLTAAVSRFGPTDAKRAVEKLYRRTSVLKNPAPVRIPFREGQKIPIERARAWVRSTGNLELMRQFEDAERLQTRANKKPKFVFWKTLPIGSPKKIEMVTAFAHYGESPETMYKPPPGSKKGRSMYRHKWGDGSGRSRPVPVLAAPSGKAIIKVMGSGQKTGDWMRG